MMIVTRTTRLETYFFVVGERDGKEAVVYVSIDEPDATAFVAGDMDFNLFSDGSYALLYYLACHPGWLDLSADEQMTRFESTEWDLVVS